MSNPSKAKGTQYEVSLLPALKAYYPDATRRPTEGKNDKGDFKLPGEDRFIIEAKNRTQLELPKWLREAAAEAKNAEVPVGVVVHKRKGTQDPGEQYVTLTLADFLALLNDYSASLSDVWLRDDREA